MPDEGPCLYCGEPDHGWERHYSIVIHDGCGRQLAHRQAPFSDGGGSYYECPEHGTVLPSEQKAVRVVPADEPA